MLDIDWTDAPEGTTHYSLCVEHYRKWHKLDEQGDWWYAEYDENHGYEWVLYEYYWQEIHSAKLANAIPNPMIEEN